MKALAFIYEILRKFPLLLISSTVLLVGVSFIGAFSLFAISPIVDFFVHPDMQGVSVLTQKAFGVLEYVGLPVSLGSCLTIFVGFVVLTCVFQVFARYLILRTEYAVMRNIILGTFEDFFNSSWHFFSSGKQGELLNTFNRELKSVGCAFTGMAMFFSTVLQTTFFLAVPFIISWQVTLISLCVALIFMLPFIVMGRYCYRLGQLTTATANRVSSVIHENLSLAKVVLGFGNQNKSVANLADAFDAHRAVAVKGQVVSKAMPVLYRPFGVIAIVIALFAARWFGIALSEITVLLLALLQVALTIGNLTMHKSSMENFFPSYEQIKRLRQRAGKLRQISGDREFKRFSRQLAVEGVSFSYPSRQDVLIDINVRIPKGSMVAFVGESGAGKSTLIDIVMGFHQPAKGVVKIDGVELKEFDVYSYRRKTGYVPQDSVLFNMSIRDNLLWASESAGDEQIEQACQLANADEFIRQLPDGLDTIVGDRGVRLSGGQVQRIALARAILRQPELLILDEATSSLDTYSERLIQQAIEKIARQTTVVAIAHRLSTIVNADYIYVLKEGHIVEQGTYPELVEADGHFRSMAELQVLETR